MDKLNRLKFLKQIVEKLYNDENIEYLWVKNKADIIRNIDIIINDISYRINTILEYNDNMKYEKYSNLL